MRLVFTGTHIHNALKAEFNFMPEVGDLVYPTSRIQVPNQSSNQWLNGYKGELDVFGSPVSILNYDAWLATVPKVWVTNPRLTHFVPIGEMTTKEELLDYIYVQFNPTIIKNIDSIMARPNNGHYIGALMRSIPKVLQKPVGTSDLADLIASVNQRFAGINTYLLKGAEGLDIQHQTLDVGSVPGDFSTASDLHTYTDFEVANPANENATCTTVKVWLKAESGSDLWVGSFFLVSGTTYQVRDSESCGSVASGSEQTISGTDISFQTGDYIGVFAKSGTCSIEMNSTGGLGVRYVSGEYIDPGDSVAYSILSNYKLALWGEGAVAVGIGAESMLLNPFGINEHGSVIG